MSRLITTEVISVGLGEALRALGRLANYSALPNFPHRRFGIKSRYKGRVPR